MRSNVTWMLCALAACNEHRDAAMSADAKVAAPTTRKTCSPCASTADCDPGWECEHWDLFPTSSKDVCKTAAEHVSPEPECNVDCRMDSWRGCKDTGACGLVDGQCVPTNDADCAASTQCQYVGACTFIAAEARCGAASDADCATSSDCLAKGNCTVHDGVCMTQTACGWQVSANRLKPDTACNGNVGCTHREVHCECACDQCADELCLSELCDDSYSCFVDAH